MKRLRHLWEAWLRLIAAEDAHWRSQLNGDPAPDESRKASCQSAPETPSIADLVRQRQTEVKHGRLN
jgi:hypothetical protein